MKIDDTWVLELFRIDDAKDAVAFGRACIEDATLPFGNNPAIVGRKQIEQTFAEFYASLNTLRHEVTDV